MSLVPADWLFLEGLGAEVGHRQGTRGTTSDAVRYAIHHLLESEWKKPGRVEIEKRADGTVESTFAFFVVGAGPEGQEAVLRLDLQSGEKVHLLRSKIRPDELYDSIKAEVRKRQAVAAKSPKRPRAKQS